MKIRVRKTGYVYDWVLIAGNNRVLAASSKLWMDLGYVKEAAKHVARNLEIHYESKILERAASWKK